MNDLEVLGLEIRDYSKYKSKDNCNDEMIERIEKVNQHHDNYQKYHVYNPIRTEKDYDKDLQFYIVKHHFGQLDWMGYGYTELTFITAKDYKDVYKYCEKTYGKNGTSLYYNIEYTNYVINQVTIREYLIEVNNILNKIKEYEDLPCINPNWRTIGMKVCVSEGIPVRMKNGQMEYECRGDVERYYPPKPLDEIGL